MANLYPIRVAARMTGISLDTLRAWERRYEAIKPARGERGRLYDEDDIRRLRLLRAATEAGHAIGQIASLSGDELERLKQAAGGKAAPGGDGAPSANLAPLLKAIQDYDASTLAAGLGRFALALTPADLVHLVVLPLMREAGERWERGSFRIAQEHLLSGAVRNLLGALVHRQDARGSAGRIVFATPHGELHEFGVLAAALLAVGRHYEAVYLGPNLPAAEILHASTVMEPKAVVVAVTASNTSSPMRAAVKSLARKLAPGIELWIGGTGALEAAHAVSDRCAVLDDLVEFEQKLETLRP